MKTYKSSFLVCFKVRVHIDAVHEHSRMDALAELGELEHPCRMCRVP